MTDPFHIRPLENKTAVIACSEQKRSALTEGLEALGATVVHFPVIEIRAAADTGLLDDALDHIGDYSWIIFTSTYGVRFFMERLEGHGPLPFPMPKICAIGPATAEAVRRHGHNTALLPDKFVAEGIIEALARYHGGIGALLGQRILIPRAKEAREILPEALTAAGARVDIVPCYENVQPEADAGLIQRLQTIRPDLMVFTSSSALRNMIDILGHEDGKSMLLRTVVAVLGPITGSTAESFGKRPEIIPKESTVASLLEEICGFYSRIHQR